jgi:hypothetical protein
MEVFVAVSQRATKCRIYRVLHLLILSAEVPLERRNAHLCIVERVQLGNAHEMRRRLGLGSGRVVHCLVDDTCIQALCNVNYASVRSRAMRGVCM